MKFPDIKQDAATPYDTWVRNPTNANMSSVLTSLDSTINSALKTYSGGNISPLVRGRARYLTTQAVRSYNPKLGTSLKSHVMLQLQPLTRYTNQATQPMKISERRLRQLKSLQDVERKFSEQYDRDPSDLELADELGLSIAKINRIRTYANPFISTEAAEEASAAPAVYKVDPMDAWLDYVYYDSDEIDRKILDWKLGRHGNPVLRNVEIAKKLKMTPAAITKRAINIQKRIYAGQEVLA